MNPNHFGKIMMSAHPARIRRSTAFVAPRKGLKRHHFRVLAGGLFDF